MRGHALAFLSLLALLGGCSGGGGSSATADRITGIVQAALGTAVDGDLNNPEPAAVANDTPELAQQLAAPVVVGGFASGDPTRVPGDRFGGQADFFDIYRVSLRAGQGVTLQVADFDPLDSSRNDLDLLLYRTDDLTEPVDDSLELAEFEQVRAPADAEYYVVVEGFAGASNYSLLVGFEAAAQTLRRQFPPAAEFVPGELIAWERPSPGKAGKKTRSGWRAAFQAEGGRIESGGGRLLRLRFDPSAASAAPKASAFRSGGKSAAAGRIATIRRLKRLAREAPELGRLSLNYIRRPAALPTDPLLPLQWHYDQIGLERAWSMAEGGGGGVRVAVLDTGIVAGHPDLAANVSSDGYDFVSSLSAAADGDGIDPDPTDPGDGTATVPDSWHGTHVAGTVAAVAGNGLGGSGVAFGASLVPVRVLGRGGGSDYDLIQGILYAAGLPNDSGTRLAQPVDVINLSLGGTGFSAALQQAILDARGQGVIVVAAAGNEGSSEPHYPAAMDGVISVSAVRFDRTLAPYSNRGSTIDLAAPGGDLTRDQNGDGNPDGVFSTLLGQNGAFGYGFLMGTSMAAPHVSGVVALMRSIWPALSPAELDGAISAGLLSEDLAGNGAALRDDQFGYGLIDAWRAVQYAAARAGGGTLPAFPLLSPSSLTFAPGESERLVELTRGGSGTLVVESTGVSAGWLSLAPVAVDGDGLGSWQVRVDRSSLTAGSWSGEVHFELLVDGAPQTLVLPVVAEVASDTGSANVGAQYLLLLGEDQETVIDQQLVEADDGSYSFSFGDLAPGTYYLLSGSDFDNDGFICDPGESCGGYPVLSRLEPLVWSGGTLSVSFSSSYVYAATGASAQWPKQGFPLIRPRRPY